MNLDLRTLVVGNATALGVVSLILILFLLSGRSRPFPGETSWAAGYADLLFNSALRALKLDPRELKGSPMAIVELAHDRRVPGEERRMDFPGGTKVEICFPP